MKKKGKRADVFDAKPFAPEEIEELRAFLQRRREASPTMQGFYSHTGQDPSIEAFARLLATLDQALEKGKATP